MDRYSLTHTRVDNRTGSLTEFKFGEWCKYEDHLEWVKTMAKRLGEYEDEIELHKERYESFKRRVKARTELLNKD